LSKKKVAQDERKMTQGTSIRVETSSITKNGRKKLKPQGHSDMDTQTDLQIALPVEVNTIGLTYHKLIIGNCMSMEEISDNSVHLMVTSPPYFNAPFDYKGLFKNYGQYLGVLTRFAKETYRVLQDGRIAVLNIDDMLVNGEKFPIVADTTKIFVEAGFRYRDRIIWKKPDGYLRISRRSGVMLQNPYPMYFYPDNLLESIIIFQKGKFDYRLISKEIREHSKINVKEFSDKKWYMTLWEINNVMPGAVLEKDIAAFPEELPYRIIKLFAYKGETVLDPFAGSGTTMKVARDLRRNSVGIEIKASLVPVIKKKLEFGEQGSLLNSADTFEIIYRNNGPYGHIR
jgi:site-specific DNA-methyltransferase (adenine-specific)